MKQLTFLIMAVSLLSISQVSMAQKKPTDPTKQKQTMEMMQDSTMMSMMMEHIAKDDHMRNMMMHKMMQSVKGDEAEMMEICKAMIADQDMHSMMMKMMKGDMGMMEPESMQKQDEKEGHEQHHQGQGSETQTSDSGREVLIRFKPDAKAVQIKAMSEDIGMQQVKEIKALNLRVFKITSDKSLDEVIEHCKQEPFVEYAEPNQTYKTQEK
ncbi:hypothetical protein GWO43_24425 [candidate division KSB1 bacterium]|nr:hypothetical protein [candidate division KSB1 bacterium]NIR69044.1 hypothetical protein [candidate division KSB1 bacterium]NIS25612.1 hypothetical protein [candidate division KSB1 bacterium]NIT73962.1 hypothetical protein [candidate division KSB1 bacterium]NIU26289.1 hypothetical protein [candidate division KSB1 bacterium]